MAEYKYLSRSLECACCGNRAAVTHAPEARRYSSYADLQYEPLLPPENGIYEVKENDPICEPRANVLGWLVEP